MIGELFMVEVIDFDDQRMFTKVYQSMDIENVKKAVEKEVCEMLETTAEDTVESKWPQENTEFAVGNINVSGGNYRVSIEMISPIIV